MLANNNIIGIVSVDPITNSYYQINKYEFFFVLYTIINSFILRSTFDF